MPMDVFKGVMDQLIRQIKNAPKAQGAERIYLPGEMEWERHEQVIKEGRMNLPEHVMVRLRGLAEDYKIDIRTLLVE